MVIEVLRFEVDPADRPRWLEVEEAVWTRFLERQDGYVRKERWLHADDPSAVSVVIWWETLEQWKRISAAEVEAVDQEMGEWFRPVVRDHTFHVLGS